MFYTDIYRRGETFYYSGWEDNGKRIRKKFNQYRPSLFVPSKNPTKYQTLHGSHVELMQPGSIKDCTDFLESYSKVPGFDIYGNEKWLYQFISDAHPEELNPDFSMIRVGKIDIETACESGFPTVENVNDEVLLITVLYNGQYQTWGTQPYVDSSGKNNLTYHYCESEEELLMSFMSAWREYDFDVITGWNIKNFDIPYLVRRIRKLFGEDAANSLSPWGIISERERPQGAKTLYEYNIKGITTYDYLDLYKKFTYTAQESYKLDHIAYVELKKSKLDYSEYGSIRELYRSDWNKFVDYNIQDVYIIQKLDDKLKLIDLCLTLAYNAKVNYEDVFFQVRMWDAIIYNHLKEQNIVIPISRSHTKMAQNIGAYVKEPRPGMHDWIVSFDVTSMYPHLIMTYNISPETIVDDKKKYLSVDDLLYINDDLSELKSCNETMAANGVFFTKEKQGFLPLLMKKMFQMRNDTKKQMMSLKKEDSTKHASKIASLDAKQQALKVCLNSAYGALSNAFCRWFRIELAEAITVSGQLTIRWAELRMNEFLNRLLRTEGKEYVVYADTDSIYVNMNPLVCKILPNCNDEQKITNFLNAASESQIQPEIEKMFQSLGYQMNAFEQAIEMKREVIANKAIWIAKKKYIMRMLDSEGERFAEPKLKMMGVETVRSSTPEVCRDELKKAIKLIMETDEETVLNHIEDFRKRFHGCRVEQIAFPRGCNGLRKYRSPDEIYKKGTPIQVRGALMYNHLLEKHDLLRKYQEISEGDKIKFVYLKTPNMINENIISFLDIVPPEFEIQESVDYDLQFEKTFISPLENILKTIGWKTERVNDLCDFFG